MEHDITDYMEVVIDMRKHRMLEDIVRGHPTIPCQRMTPESVKAIAGEFKNKMELTVTFRNDLLNKYTPSYIQKSLKHIFDKSRGICEYILIQDYSKEGRLHYHGLLDIYQLDSVQSIRNKIGRLFGRVEIAALHHEVEYIDYMVGQYIPEHKKYISNIEWNDTRYIMSRKLEDKYIYGL